MIVFRSWDSRLMFNPAKFCMYVHVCACLSMCLCATFAVVLHTFPTTKKEIDIFTLTNFDWDPFCRSFFYREGLTSDNRPGNYLVKFSSQNEIKMPEIWQFLFIFSFRLYPDIFFNILQSNNGTFLELNLL